MDEETLEILRDFTSESREALDTIEPLIIELEGGRAEDVDADTVDAAFRFFHSMKGTASFLEFEHVVELTHVSESLLDLIRKGVTPLLPRHVDMLCEALDLARKMLDAIDDTYTDDAFAEPASSLAGLLQVAVDDAKGREDQPSEDSEGTMTAEKAVDDAKGGSDDAPTEVNEVSDGGRANDGMSDFFAAMMTPEMIEKFRVETEEHLDAAEDALMKLDPAAPDMPRVEASFRSLHSVKGNASLFGFTQLSIAAHALENTLDDIRNGQLAVRKEIIDSLLQGVDTLRSLLGESTAPKAPPAASAEEAPETKAATKKEEPKPSPRAGQSAPKKPASNRGSSIRVDTDKLDDLMNLVGELIIAETTVTHNPDLEGHHFESFQKAATQLNRLTRRLQQVTMAVRMVPVVSTFRKMLRLVRDVSTKQQKEVVLVVEGEQTEVDKTVIEMIGDPLVHMIRNAVDHGIESPEERRAAGKPEQGTIRLSAAHEGQEVWITIKDDGRGLSREKILAKAVEKGIVGPDDNPSDAEVYKMIFAAGFSTAAEVTDISGRGVGMDVALRNIEAMNGRVDIHSQPGEGSTFILRIPLTLAIIEGMLVRVGPSAYTLPLLSIREHVRASEADISRLPDGTELFRLRDNLYPIYHLRDLYGTDARTSIDEGILILVCEGEHTVCVLVDEVIGQRQTVIKPVPDYLRGVRGISGCSILHNGEICLILDVEGLVKRQAMAA
ncbi:MAG: chemotaxis protein CheA [Myxococcota bacterium]